jgi:hypothetical protein
MSHDPHRRVIALWRQPSNVVLAGWLADMANTTNPRCGENETRRNTGRIRSWRSCCLYSPAVASWAGRQPPRGRVPL